MADPDTPENHTQDEPHRSIDGLSDLGRQGAKTDQAEATRDFPGNDPYPNNDESAADHQNPRMSWGDGEGSSSNGAQANQNLHQDEEQKDNVQATKPEINTTQANRLLNTSSGNPSLTSKLPNGKERNSLSERAKYIFESDEDDDAEIEQNVTAIQADLSNATGGEVKGITCHGYDKKDENVDDQVAKNVSLNIAPLCVECLEGNGMIAFSTDQMVRKLTSLQRARLARFK